MNLSDRARELLEWLRGMAEVATWPTAYSQGNPAQLAEAAAWKSRAETLAENERLRSALQRIANLPLGRDGNQSVRARRIAIAALGGDPGSTPKRTVRAATKAEPESDPGLPAGSSATINQRSD